MEKALGTSLPKSRASAGKRELEANFRPISRMGRGKLMF